MYNPLQPSEWRKEREVIEREATRALIVVVYTLTAINLLTLL